MCSNMLDYVQLLRYNCAEVSAVHTNIDIDKDLLEKVVKRGGFRTKKAAVNEALAQLDRMQSQADIIELFGTIDFDPDWDYKADRRAR